MADTVPASEFTRNFGRYRMLAQREAVAVSSHGSITGYFVAPDEYEEFRRFKQRRRSFARKLSKTGICTRSGLPPRSRYGTHRATLIEMAGTSPATTTRNVNLN